MTDSFIIRKANLDDLDNILALLNLPVADNGHTMTRVDAGLMLQTILDDPNYFQIVASTDSGIMGMVTLVIIMQMSHEGASSALITDLIVSAEKDNSGAVQQLLQYATNLAQEYGCYKTTIQSDYQTQLSIDACIELGYEQGPPSFKIPAE
jgi:N-acetylglutamate synthase-like GNAT family acetyltransferase